MNDVPQSVFRPKENVRLPFATMFENWKKPKVKDMRKEALNSIHIACFFATIIGVLPFFGILFVARSLVGSWESISYSYFIESYLLSNFLVCSGAGLWLFLKKTTLPAAILFFFCVSNIILEMVTSKDIRDGIYSLAFYSSVFGVGLWGAIRLKQLNEKTDE